MGEAILWWLTLEILGLVALPIAWVLLRALPDRGYSASKILGLLLVGWLGYTASMAQLVPFERWVLLLCVLAVAGLSAWLLLRRGREMWNRFSEHYRSASAIRYIIVAEILFTALFVIWAWVRAWQPNIVDQEKFMDFGFLNSILKTGVLPPHDMWLAGQSINYYYFGYILIAALTALSGVATEIAFNLANASLFALTALGGFGAVYNLIAGALQRRQTARAGTSARSGGSRRRAQVTEPMRAATGRSQSRAAVPTRRARAGQPIEQAKTTMQATAVAEAPRAQKRLAEVTDVSSDGLAAGGDTEIVETKEPPTYAPVDERVDAPVRRVPWFLSPYIYAVIAALMLVAMGNLSTFFAVKDGGTSDLEGNGFRPCFGCIMQQDPRSYNWFAASRIVQDYRTVDGQKQKVGFETINEFPAFSFLLADLHPHVMALPLVLLAISVGQAWSRRRVLRGSRWRDLLRWDTYSMIWLAAAVVAIAVAAVLVLTKVLSGGQLVIVALLAILSAFAFRFAALRDLQSALSILVAAIIIGSLYTTNTWDYPSYALVALAGLAIPYLAAYRGRRATFWGAAGGWFIQAVGVIGLSLAVFLPFHLTFKSLVGGQPPDLPSSWANVPVLGWILQKLGTLVLINTSDKTILGFVVIFGIFLSALLVWLLFELGRYLAVRWRETQDPRGEQVLWAIWAGVLLVIFAAALILRFPLLALLVPIAIISIYLIWREPRRTERNFALLLLAIGALIGFAVEIVFLRDNFQMRMNTLFKFYFQIWVLWAVAAGFGLWRTLSAAFERRAAAQTGADPEPASSGKMAAMGAASVWAVLVLLLVASGLTYSYYGVMSRQVAGGGNALHGLDGTKWLATTAPGDYDGINWLKSHGTGNDVVLEAGSAEYYRPGRVSSYSGVATLVAWDTSHERLWRTNQPELLDMITQRRKVVNSIYQGTDPNTGAPLTAESLLSLLHQYSVDYVFVGATEHGDFGGVQAPQGETITDYADGLFRSTLDAAFRSGNTTVYRVKEQPAGTGTPPPTPVPGTTPGATGNQPDPNAQPVDLFAAAGQGVNRGQFSLPRGIAQDVQGNVYVVDTGNMRVQVFDRSGKWLRSFGTKGNGDGQFAPMNDTAAGTGPGGIAVDKDGNVYVADTWNHRLQKFDKDGKFVKAWGTFVNLGDPNSPSDPNRDKGFYGPRGVAVGPDGSVYVTDTGNKRVMIFDPDGNYERQISSGMGPDRTAPQHPFNQPGELNEPIGIAVGPDGSVYVADTNNGRVQKFDGSGKPVAQWPVPQGSWAPGPYLEPFLALDAQGNVYATAPTSHAVLKLSPSGQLLGQKNSSGSSALGNPTGITMTADGKAYVVDTSANAVVDLGTIP